MRAIVIGAGPAGLATAACLGNAGLDVTLLERASEVGERWREHYDRLVLHTSKARSALPGMPLPSDWPRYVSRDQLVEYLEDYTRFHDLQPRFGTEVQDVTRDGAVWRVTAADESHEAEVVVIATGLAQRPRLPTIPGLAAFDGPVVHSSGYQNPRDIDGQHVLVIGFGNSGGDIALDLADAGRDVEVVVRGPVNLLPKEMFGVPITSFELLTRLLPYTWADAITAPLLRVMTGRPEAYGMVKAEKGPAAQVIEDGRVPLIDVGTLAAIRDGRIRVRPAIDRFEGGTAIFADGKRSDVDAVVLATGYAVDLRPLLPSHPEVLDKTGAPTVSGARTKLPGLYFCSYAVSANGQLRRMSQEALAITADAVRGRDDVVADP